MISLSPPVAENYTGFTTIGTELGHENPTAILAFTHKNRVDTQQDKGGWLNAGTHMLFAITNITAWQLSAAVRNSDAPLIHIQLLTANVRLTLPLRPQKIPVDFVSSYK